MKPNSFLIASFVTILTLPFLLKGFDRKILSRYPEVFLHRNETRVSKTTDKTQGWIDFSISDPKTAKKEKLFWATDSLANAAALNLRKDPEIFSALFPGYDSQVRTDEELWSRYFLREFDPNSHLYFFKGTQLENYMVAYSWTGCFDLYKKAGADVIVLGSSEVHRSILPDLLGERLKSHFNGRSPKVLMCLTSGMPVATVAETLRRLASIRTEKIPVVIWGYSFWGAFTQSQKLQAIIQEKNKYLGQYDGSTSFGGDGAFLNRLQSLRMSEYFPPINWDFFLQSSFQEIRKFNRSQREGTLVPSASIQSNAKLANFLTSDLIPFYNVLLNIDATACKLSLAEKELVSVLEQAHKMSERFFVYLVPTTQFQILAAPTCFRDEVRKMLSKNVKKEFLLLDEFEKYELSLSDYLEKSDTKDAYYFSNNHTNFMGAVKVTEHVSGWVLKNL